MDQRKIRPAVVPRAPVEHLIRRGGKVSGLNPDAVTSKKRFRLLNLFFMYYTYVLRSLKNGMLYKGSTQDLQSRVVQHNAGLVSFTSKYCPWELVYYETFPTRAEAMAREKYFKTGKGREWIKEKLGLL